jgi:galactokinase
MLQAIESLSRILSTWAGSPADRAVTVGFVPGRIEVFGRHTDYAGGRTIVCAIDKGFLFAAAPREDRRIRMREDSPEFAPAEFDLDPNLTPVVGQWANYPMTMARRLERNFPGRLRGVDIVFSSTMPVGSGMSGSSALMMMVYTAIAASNTLEAAPEFQESIRSPVDLSVYLACAENGQSFRGLAGDRGVGTFGGSEDHAAILNGRAGCLTLFSFSPPELLAEVPWPADWRMVVAFSGVRAEKTREALEKYNMASRRAREAVAVFNRLSGRSHPTLREVVDHEPKPSGEGWLRELDRAAAADGGMAPSLGDRVRQFILEDRVHVPRAIEALKTRDLARFGQLLSDSHRASKKDLWNIVPEIDWLMECACGLGAAGASGFGAGFGGSIFAVTTADQAEALLGQWRRRYTAGFPDRAREADFFIAEPSPGIQLWKESGPVRYVDTVFSPRSSPKGS